MEKTVGKAEDRRPWYYLFRSDEDTMKYNQVASQLKIIHEMNTITGIARARLYKVEAQFIALQAEFAQIKDYILYPETHDLQRLEKAIHFLQDGYAALKSDELFKQRAK